MANNFNTYRHFDTNHLKKLRSAKYNRIAALERRNMGYFDQQELRRLRGQIHRIDVELNCRALQNELPLE